MVLLLLLMQVMMFLSCTHCTPLAIVFFLSHANYRLTEMIPVFVVVYIKYNIHEKTFFYKNCRAISSFFAFVHIVIDMHASSFFWLNSSPFYCCHFFSSSLFWRISNINLMHVSCFCNTICVHAHISTLSTLLI